ncbi:response regulator [Candidatus Poribacteria bacterium]|nr:response regulator [Candidatus Poribacteria bacterium]
MEKIFVVEDDPAHLLALEDNLEYANYEVTTAKTGHEALKILEKESFDLIILDIMLPYINGFEVCQHLRKSGDDTPIIMLTAKVQEQDRVQGLDIGADDYVTKPFSMAELLARIRAVLRRFKLQTRLLEQYSFGDMEFDFKKYEARKDGVNLDISSREFQILKMLITHEGEVVTRDDIIGEIWGYDDFPTERTIDTHIARLRQKLENDPAKPKHIITVYGAGYKFQR